MPRFYQFEYKLKADKLGFDNDPVPTPTTREWFPSERDAVVRRLDLFKAGKLLGKKKDNEIWPVDIPTRKEDMLAWLRKECV